MCGPTSCPNPDRCAQAVVWGSLVPAGRHGSTYDSGMVHVTDWHATFAALAGATLPPRMPLDGKDIWGALVGAQASPTTEFLVNYDPCSGHGVCAGVEWGYREGDLKLMYGVAQDTWYALPTSDTLNGSSPALFDPLSGDVWWPDEHYVTGAPSSSSTLSDKCVAAVKESCPSGTVLCSGCISEHWDAISKSCSVTEEKVASWMCYGVTAWLFNVTADPSEKTNLLDTNPTQYEAAVSRIQAKVMAIVNGDDYLAPPNTPTGRCSSQDPNAAAVIAAHGELYPWVNSSSGAF